MHQPIYQLILQKLHYRSFNIPVNLVQGIESLGCKTGVLRALDNNELKVHVKRFRVSSRLGLFQALRKLSILVSCRGRFGKRFI